MFGNILVGGIIGAAVDMGSGAAYTYPPSLIVAMSPTSDSFPPPPLAANSPSVAVSPRMGKEEAEKALKTLSDLRKKKLIRDAEYQERVRDILARM